MMTSHTIFIEQRRNMLIEIWRGLGGSSAAHQAEKKQQLCDESFFHRAFVKRIMSTDKEASRVQALAWFCIGELKIKLKLELLTLAPNCIFQLRKYSSR